MGDDLDREGLERLDEAVARLSGPVGQLRVIAEEGSGAFNPKDTSAEAREAFKELRAAATALSSSQPPTDEELTEDECRALLGPTPSNRRLIAARQSGRAKLKARLPKLSRGTE